MTEICTKLVRGIKFHTRSVFMVRQLSPCFTFYTKINPKISFTLFKDVSAYRSSGTPHRMGGVPGIRHIVLFDGNEFKREGRVTFSGMTFISNLIPHIPISIWNKGNRPKRWGPMNGYASRPCTFPTRI